MKSRSYLVLLCFLFIGYSYAQIKNESIEFHNDDVKLRGTLYMPASAHPVPAIIFLHGSGPVNRDASKAVAQKFVKTGIAVLTYDKRGVGESTGSWISASLDDLAEDVLAAVDFIKEDPRIDESKIGFWGVSQAGWVASKASGQSKDISFMILNSGGGASPVESEMFSFKQLFDKWNFNEQETEIGLNLLQSYYSYLETGENRDMVIAKRDSLKNLNENKLSQLGGMIIVPSEKNRKNWSWVATYDPLADINKMKMPLLLMFGDKDKDSPTDLAMSKWEEGLTAAGNENYTIFKFFNASHGIRKGEMHSLDAPYADGFFELMVGWLNMNVTKPILKYSERVSSKSISNNKGLHTKTHEHINH